MAVNDEVIERYKLIGKLKIIDKKKQIKLPVKAKYKLIRKHQKNNRDIAKTVYNLYFFKIFFFIFGPVREKLIKALINIKNAIIKALKKPPNIN